MDKAELDREWMRLRNDHTLDRDRSNNYGCFNIEACQNCNYVYNSRSAINCHNSDTLVECVQCVDCRDCAYCVGLNGARFHILNREYSEQDYFAMLEALGINASVDTFDPVYDDYPDFNPYAK